MGKPEDPEDQSKATDDNVVTEGLTSRDEKKFPEEALPTKVKDTKDQTKATDDTCISKEKLTKKDENNAEAVKKAKEEVASKPKTEDTNDESIDKDDNGVPSDKDLVMDRAQSSI